MAHRPGQPRWPGRGGTLQPGRGFPARWNEADASRGGTAAPGAWRYYREIARLPSARWAPRSWPPSASAAPDGAIPVPPFVPRRRAGHGAGRQHVPGRLRGLPPPSPAAPVAVRSPCPGAAVPTAPRTAVTERGRFCLKPRLLQAQASPPRLTPLASARGRRP